MAILRPRNLFEIIGYLQRREGLHLKIHNRFPIGGEFEQTDGFVHEGEGNTGSTELASPHRQCDRVPMNEATARIKINKLLEAAGWRFFADGDKPANICLETGVTIKASDLDPLGDDFEKTSKGYIDFLLLDTKGFPYIVLEAKSEDKNPLVGKEQARKYARSQNCRFVILSNGNLHYFWDLERGSPYVITSFPTPESVSSYRKVAPNPQRLIEERVGDDYIVLTHRPNYASEAAWKNEAERPGFIQANKLCFLRTYQLRAIHALQRAVQDGGDRFLFEMATGTRQDAYRRGRQSSCSCAPAMPAECSSWLIGWN